MIDGGDDYTEGTITIPIEKIIPHPQYNHKNALKWHDIALIRMAEMANYTGSLQNKEIYPALCMKNIFKFSDVSGSRTLVDFIELFDRYRKQDRSKLIKLPQIVHFLFSYKKYYGTWVSPIELFEPYKEQNRLFNFAEFVNLLLNT